MAIIRAICSLTAASRKHLNRRTLNETGTISSRMLAASGRNSYGTRSPGRSGASADRRALKRLAGPTVQFLGKLPDAEVAQEFARCRALIFPGEEDFGLTPVECMASGRPVVAYGRGGALETVTPGKTGVFFDAQTPESLMEALQAVSSLRVVPEELQAEAFRFDSSVFAARMSAFVAEAAEKHRVLYQRQGGPGA